MSVLEPVAQSLSFHQLHYQVVGADIVQRADVRMTQKRNRSRFALETPAELFGTDLDSHFAARQSSITVSGETWRIVAVSSTPNPPKKRSSITSLCRGWSFDRRLSASSSAINPASRSSETAIPSSSGTASHPPPRFAA